MVRINLEKRDHFKLNVSQVEEVSNIDLNYWYETICGQIYLKNERVFS